MGEGDSRLEFAWRFKVRVCLEILVKSRGKCAGRICQRFQRNILKINKGRQAWCHDQSRQGGALGQRGKTLNHQKDEVVIFQGENTCGLDKYEIRLDGSRPAEKTRQGLEFDMEEAVRVYLDRLQRIHAPKVSWWSLRSGDSAAGQVTAEETRHGLEFDMEEALSVYLDRLQRMHAPKVSWWSLRSGDSTAGQIIAEETHHRLEFDMEKCVREYLKRASQAWMMRDMYSQQGGVVWCDQLISTSLRVCSRWSLAGQGYEVNQKSLQRWLSGGFCWQQQRCRMMFKISGDSGSVRVSGQHRHQVNAEASMEIIKCMVVTEVIGLHGCYWRIEVEQVKLNRWMKPDELYSEYVRLRRSVLRRLQEMQKVSMSFALASRKFEVTEDSRSGQALWCLALSGISRVGNMVAADRAD
ncbi:hypothetical protein F2Q69_00020769 [Brassica cretica]|uniref:Uncharacterized protein n=1 Tax=Brassica cretica TaxID=69181 RepID=A0A8S9QEE3_BRACR|nr:hypothetical protein F2Q69_00020769 [Brassica cretica]